MSALETIIKLIDELNKEFTGWMELVKDDQELTGNYDKNMKNKIFELVFLVKEQCIEQEKNVEELLKEVISEDKIISILKKQVDISMIYYKMLQPIRKMSFQDGERAKAMIEDIFSNYILRLDYAVFDRYKYLDDNSENSIKKLFSALDRLTDYYVEHLFVQKQVQNDFKMETGISEEVCAFYAQLYEENFKELKVNLIMNKLTDLENALSESEET